MILNWIVFILSIPFFFLAATAIINTLHPQSRYAMMVERMIREDDKVREIEFLKARLKIAIWEIEKEKERGSMDG